MDLTVLRDDLIDGLEHPTKGVLENERLSAAMRTVPRHEFVDIDSPEAAYTDQAFTERGTTVLSPSLVARLLEALAPRPDDEVLVVGCGVGYTAAVLAEMVGPTSVSAVDLARSLVIDARRNLERTGYGAVFVDRRDGADGLPEYAPFDRILVEAAAVQPPRALLDQLTDTGRLVMPLGANDQDLVAIGGDSDPDGELEIIDRFGPVRFKPLLVEGEQPDTIERNRTAREEQERAQQQAQRRHGWEQDWIDWDRTLNER
ncbi:MAG: protein-L-isoaspartate O-methyltransferase [Halobacteriales archaeon]|nr:protein-L-isoaspartate O-methyltransferase [Halobacteriales archaeon]